MPLRFVLMFVALALVGSAVACGGNIDPAGAALDAGDAEVIEISIGGPGPPRFRPSLVEVPRGTTAVFQITGTDNLNHSFTITRLNIDLRLSPGETVETEPLRLHEVTNIFFICRLHTASGATGTIRVTN